MAPFMSNGQPDMNGDAEATTTSLEPVLEAADHIKPPPTVKASDQKDEEEWVYPYPTSFKLSEHPIDAPREISVAILGAGLAGVLAGILLPIKVPGIKLTILEKNADVGGTWFENVYPGVRCDIPAHVYQSTFEPNTQWTEAFARGPEIQAYWAGLARKYNLYDITRFNHRVTGCYWKPDTAKWEVNVTDTTDSNDKKELKEYYDILMPSIGHFNDWRLPDIPGMDQFQGLLRHASNWDRTFDPTGKRIAVIGNGASGIQILPELQKVASHIDHYARSRTWIAGSLGGLDRQVDAMPYSAEQRKEFGEDPEKYTAFRKALEETYWNKFENQIRDSEGSRQSAAKFRELMAERLKDKPELLDQIVPNFPPHCRRLTPGPGYLEALTKPNVTYITTPISHFTPTGIVTINNTHHPIDAVICATGANVDFAPPFPIVNASGIDLMTAWRPDGFFGFPYSYLGFATPGFPNLIHIHGPNAHGTAGTITHSIETQLAYFGKLLRKFISQGIRTIQPTKAATDDFVEYCDAFFPRTNLSRNCSSWANGRRPGARIHGLWPGSQSHVTIVRRDPRWEDWEYEYLRPENRFAYWGNGVTVKEQEKKGDMVPFLKKEACTGELDLRDLHERWWDL